MFFHCFFSKNCLFRSLYFLHLTNHDNRWYSKPDHNDHHDNDDYCINAIKMVGFLTGGTTFDMVANNNDANNDDDDDNKNNVNMNNDANIGNNTNVSKCTCVFCTCGHIFSLSW